MPAHRNVNLQAVRLARFKTPPGSSPERPGTPCSTAANFVIDCALQMVWSSKLLGKT